jgi:adenosine/AMP kinase
MMMVMMMMMLIMLMLMLLMMMLMLMLMMMMMMMMMMCGGGNDGYIIFLSFLSMISIYPINILSRVSFHVKVTNAMALTSVPLMIRVLLEDKVEPVIIQAN